MAFQIKDFRSSFGKSVDLEAGASDGMLYPGIGMGENSMRWGFIQKVYGIIGVQLVFTAMIASCFVLVPSVKGFIGTPGNEWFIISAMILPFATLVPLYCYRYNHPLNLGLLAVWTGCMSLMVGIACTAYSGAIVLEALVLTATVVLALTAYTFYASRKGQDFNFLGPMLFAGLMALVAWGFIQFFINPGPAGHFVFALIGAMIFSMYIVYDTDNLIKRHSYDEYVWASVELYLDILNLFLRLLQILQYLQNGRD